jgi:hypothetical protein
MRHVPASSEVRQCLSSPAQRSLDAVPERFGCLGVRIVQRGEAVAGLDKRVGQASQVRLNVGELVL